MRKLRMLSKGAKYHVTAKINRGEFALEAPVIKHLFLSTIKRAKKKYSFAIFNFVIMSNHIHLIIKPLEEENLSAIMQWILSVFAVAYNKRFNIHGHLWQDRFKSKIINSFEQLAATHRYINENPVKANLCKDPRNYIWSGLWYISHNIYTLLEPPDMDMLELPKAKN